MVVYAICDGRYFIDMDIMSEAYYVWDNEEEVSLGDFYEIEVEDLLNEINSEIF